ncbi:MAG: hypothetical protein D4R81_06980 [Nitrospiraceae bacterium]|nr:MAG: hypothetical protein D4R81_06980 [Nitrospiraceae bacterium]
MFACPAEKPVADQSSWVRPSRVPAQTGHWCDGVAGEARGAVMSCERVMVATPDSQGVHKDLQSGQKNHWV